MNISTGGYIEKQTNDREMDREITYIYIYVYIYIYYDIQSSYKHGKWSATEHGDGKYFN